MAEGDTCISGLGGNKCCPTPDTKTAAVDSEATEPAIPDAVDHTARRDVRIAPGTLGVDRLPTPLWECGCGDCFGSLVDPLADGRATLYAADECPNPRPMTLRRASEVYVGYQRAAHHRDAHTSVFERHTGLYGGIMEADRRMQRRYDDGLTTASVTRRLSPTDDDGDWIEPVTLDARLHGATTAVTDALRYALRDFECEYLGVTAMTEQSATPHEHVVLWIADPDDTIEVGHFRTAVERHVEKVPGAHGEDHGDDAITVQHDPELVDHVPDTITRVMAESETATADDEALHGSVPANTAIAQYVATQLPHLVLGDVIDGTDVVQSRIDGGAIAWASPYDSVRSSHGLPL